VQEILVLEAAMTGHGKLQILTSFSSFTAEKPTPFIVRVYPPKYELKT